ncbi:trans-L-3-hydroxyproline dehydratase-like [Saccoglossus kowalevskii]
MERYCGMNINTVEMHTGGEPLRIVTDGFPKPDGKTILQKRRFVKEKLDNFRKLLMHEPRGHYDMYGALLVEPDIEDADIAVLFMDNRSYSTMCGHAVIALGRYATDYGYVRPTEPETKVNIECPCGLVKALVEYKNGKSGSVRFQSVPAFVFATDVHVDRSPCGSGVTARITLQYHKKQITLNKSRVFVNARTESNFSAKPVRQTKCGSYDAVIIEVSGRPYYSGASVFTFEEDDPLKGGFLVK